MKPQRSKLFDIIKEKLLDNDAIISVNFIERKTNKLISAKINIEYGRAYAYLDDILVEKFKKLNFESIINSIDVRYRSQWERSYGEVKLAIQKNRLVSLNSLCTGFFGPYFNPTKKTQSFNVYVTLFFKVKEIEKLNIDQDKLYRVEKISILSEQYISIDDLSNILTEANPANERTFIEGASSRVERSELTVRNSDEAGYGGTEELKLKNIKIDNLTGFNPIHVDFSSGVNLILGENSSGKTTLLKFLYASLKSLESYNKQKLNLDFGSFNESLSSKMYNVFKEPIRGIGALFAKKAQGGSLDATLTLGDDYQDGDLKFSFGEQATRTIENVDLSPLLDYAENESIVDLYNTLFVPSKEILSIYKAVKFNVNQKRIDFDDTYFDLTNCIELTAEEPDEMQSIIWNLETIINGKIEFNIHENKFVFVSDGHVFEMPMTAEGVKQIGVLSTLLKNRELKRNTILFLDEPDTNLNPRAIRPYVRMLVELAKMDIQVFITTHNEFALKQFEICAKQFQKVPIYYYSLYTNAENKKIDIEAGDLKFGQPEHNPINDEALDMYDEDIKTEFTK